MREERSPPSPRLVNRSTSGPTEHPGATFTPLCRGTPLLGREAKGHPPAQRSDTSSHYSPAELSVHSCAPTHRSVHASVCVCYTLFISALPLKLPKKKRDLLRWKPVVKCQLLHVLSNVRWKRPKRNNLV